ncbi:N-acylneuraminate cytidylyltransferase A [Anopheles ziemanni]|uniref:N-acylneuraminate cytidylyltransferase A n=1 Tax=Anopheles coustani TaxID=139045 RepID=UPI002657BCD5|nr:N-acylneuraminate cytidylyltransferase A [Anopheles coustani]XP_058169832.1 N-acylneuraminate cytidylyltransferase A [Anopheles ziemanni]
MVCRIFITISVLVGLHAGCTLGHSTQSIVALILARGGSKGIPLKNIVEIQPNQTLLGRTLDTLRRSEVFKEVWVSTDHERIALEAELHGASVFARSATHAQDHSSSLDATREFLEAHPEIDRFALVQCTSPFLRVHYLEQAAAQTWATTDDIVRWGSSCAFSVVRSHKLRWRKSETDGRLEPINFDLRARPRRQDWPGELVETGMFYFTDRQLVMEEESFQSYTCTVVEVDELDALEIDDMKDLEVARLLIGME